MRCLCCDVMLSDEETSRKHLITNEYMDTCNKCIKEIEEDLGYAIATPVSGLDDIEEDFEDE